LNFPGIRDGSGKRKNTIYDSHVDNGVIGMLSVETALAASSDVNGWKCYDGKIKLNILTDAVSAFL